MRINSAMLLLLVLLTGCGHAGSKMPSPGLGTSTNGIKFVELQIADRSRLPNQLDFATQHPVVYAESLLNGRPRYKWVSNSGFCPLNEALTTYASFTGKHILIAEDLQEFEVGHFVLSANTQRGIAEAFEKAMLSNGLVFFEAGSKTVMVVPATGLAVPPSIAPLDLRGAAELGDSKAQLRLATWYYEHRPSRPANRVEAFKWAIVAGNRQSQDAKYLLRELQLFVSPKEQADGKAAAAKFLESHPETKPRL